MTRTAFGLLLAALAVFSAANPSGSWDCFAMTPEGERLPWTLEVRQDSGAVTVTARIEQQAVKAPDARLTDGVLTFSAPYQGRTYRIKLTFEGDTLRGSYSGDDADGPITGKRRSS